MLPLSEKKCGDEGNRTPDLLNAIQALSQLSYAPVNTILYAFLRFVNNADPDKAELDYLSGQN